MSDGRQRHLLLTTPEGVTFRMPLAGPASRLLALIVDLLVVNVALSLLMGGVQLVGVLRRFWIWSLCSTGISTADALFDGT